MLKPLLARFTRAGARSVFRTNRPCCPDRFRGLPAIDSGQMHGRLPGMRRRLPDRCHHGRRTRESRLDLGRCLFCPDCVRRLPEGAIRITPEYRLAVSSREDLLVIGRSPVNWRQALDEKARKLFGRSLKLRQVSAGGCNGCESDVNVLNTVVFDLSRFGIQFVASPRHADGLLVTGPVTRICDSRCATPTMRCPPEDGHRGGRLRHLRRPVRRPSRAAKRRRPVVRSTSTFPVARRIPSPSSTDCCDCWVASIRLAQPRQMWDDQHHGRFL